MTRSEVDLMAVVRLIKERRPPETLSLTDKVAIVVNAELAVMNAERHELMLQRREIA